MLLSRRVDDLKIAIVYDWLDKWGGVERVLLTLHEMFPKAVFFTSCFDSKKAVWAKNLKIETSFIQKLPEIIRKNRIVSLPFYPYAFESFDFNSYDLVISVTSAFAKSIVTRPETRHICYLLTPTRFLWSHKQEYIKKSYELGVRSYVEYLKKWDRVASQRPDKIISISETVKERCKKYYKRQSEVIYPPFDIDYWQEIKSKIQNPNDKSNPKSKIQSYFLIVSRLEQYKKVDLAIKVFNKRKENLVIVGEGSEEKYLKRISGNNISFFCKLVDEELASLYSNATALIMPQEEDFGYVSLEAQFFGCPIIAYKKGGATETIIEGKTGIFFARQSKDLLIKAIERYNRIKYNLRTSCERFGQDNVKKFSKEKFINNFQSVISSKVEKS